MYFRKAAAIIALLSATSSALACALFLPEQVLLHRDKKLKAPMGNSFAFEVRKLAPAPKDDFKPVEDWVRGWYQPSKYEQPANSGASVPTEYMAGAADFENGNLDKAMEHFQAVVDLPDQERRSRATYAAYMLGRLAVLANDADKVAKSFKLVRDFAGAGAPDPEGLAVASFGEEALYHLRQARSLLADGRLPDSAALAYGREIGFAVSLYAEQAVRGSEGGVASLRIVAKEVVKTPGAAAATLEDPAGRRLMVVYTLASLGEGGASGKSWGWAWNHNESPATIEPDDLVRLLGGMAEKHPAEWLTDGDRLAALAYRLGRYDLARIYAEKETGPLAAWVRAKLALQAGDLTAAASFYARAAKAFPPAAEQSPIDESNRALLGAETGAVALARGEYIEALRLLDGPGDDYYLDAAYIAERVLTIDELKAYVDAKAQHRQPVRDRISEILARRMMREGRGAEAVSYYKDDATRHQASDYVSLLAAAERRWTRIGQAEAFFGAAKIARNAGLTIMGTEEEPDEVYLGGNYVGALPGHRAPIGDFVTSGEQQRFALSEVKPNKRWHYRYVAADLAEKAANLLPPRSQAFATVLACATDWTIFTDPARAQGYYARYVREGALAAGFICSEANFGRARFMTERAWIRQAKHALARPRRTGVVLFFIAAILTAFILVRRKLKSGR